MTVPSLFDLSCRALKHFDTPAGNQQLAIGVPSGLACHEKIAEPGLLICIQRAFPEENLELGWRHVCKKEFKIEKISPNHTWEQTYYAGLLDRALAWGDLKKVPLSVWDTLDSVKDRVLVLRFERSPINDEQLVEIAKLFSKLKYVELISCRSLKGEGIVELVKRRKNTLKSLTLEHSGWQLKLTGSDPLTSIKQTLGKEPSCHII